MRAEGEWECLKRGDEYCLVEYGVIFGTIVSEEKARHIVTAVNCHEELVEMAKTYRGWVEFAAGTFNLKPDPDECEKELARIDAVLAKAKKENGPM